MYRYLQPSGQVANSFAYSRGDYLPPLNFDSLNSVYPADSEVSQPAFFESISLTVSQLQQQLVDAQEKNKQQDDLLQKVQKELEDLKAEPNNGASNSQLKHKRKSPRGLNVRAL